MSLEQALKENTETMLRLIAALEAARTVGCEGTAEAELPHSVAPPEKAAEAVEPTPETLTYDDVKKPFLKLIQAKRDAAMGVMAHFGVKNMQHIPQTQEAFAEARTLILEALNG